MEPKDTTDEHNILYNNRKKRSIQKKLDVRTVVLINNEYTMDLLCNPDLVEDIKKVNDTLRIHSNGGEMTVNNKSKIPGYNKRVWFSIRDITNIIALKILNEQYIVTYDRNGQMFIVHRDGTDLPNMEFIMHDFGLHYYGPTKKDLVFLNTFSKNKKSFSKRQIKSAVKARELQHTLGFPTVK